MHYPSFVFLRQPETKEERGIKFDQNRIYIYYKLITFDTSDLILFPADAKKEKGNNSNN